MGSLADSRWTCPRDGATLTAREHLEIEFRACGRCGGLWFARDDLQRLELRAPKGSRPPSVMAAHPATEPAAGSVTCVCAGHPVMKPVERHGVTLDICSVCGGVWLDAGEIERILQCYRDAGRLGLVRPDEGDTKTLSRMVATPLEVPAAAYVVGLTLEAIGSVFDFLSSPS